MIRQLELSDLSAAADVIRTSFATVAKDFGFNTQNFPCFTGFVTTIERLQGHYNIDWHMYGAYENERLVGHVAVCNDADSVYSLHCLAVLPERRHKGYGKRLLDICKAYVKDSGGGKITVGIVEENTVLKNWYAANGFIHTGTNKFDHIPITAGYMEWEAK